MGDNVAVTELVPAFDQRLPSEELVCGQPLNGTHPDLLHRSNLACQTARPPFRAAAALR